MAKTPEQWLEETAPTKKRGLFKLFLGYAPGVGKTYSMLSEGIRRYSRGENVVIGVVESHGRPATAELAGRLPAVARKQLEYKGTTFDEMDVDAILALHPEIVLVDELAHTNIEGSRHRKRYEDVMDLLNAEIDVISTMNVQHIESVTPMIGRITGVVVRETVPDWVLQRVDEIVLADLTPEALQARMKRGDIYPLERSDRALSNFFRPGNLIALRELALRQVGSVVDRSLERYMEKEQIENRTPIYGADCGLHQFQSDRAVSDCAHREDGGEDRGGILCGVRGHWPRRCSRVSAVAGGKHPLCREPGRPDREDARQKGCGGSGQGGARKAYYPGGVRPLGVDRMEKSPLPFGHSRFSARCPAD